MRSSRLAVKGNGSCEAVTVTVTSAHIREGSKCKRQKDYDPGADCPIAIALDQIFYPRASGKRRRLVYVTAETAVWFYAKREYREFELAAEAKDFVRQYDSGAPLKRLSFDLVFAILIRKSSAKLLSPPLLIKSGLRWIYLDRTNRVKLLPAWLRQNL
ncbi:MAG TPA: hypothetical protein VK673_11860 [Chthoniobacterales bacterium]|nr:hypothetical protein [Chthoniobacterales bacterium]